MRGTGGCVYAGSRMTSQSPGHAGAAGHDGGLIDASLGARPVERASDPAARDRFQGRRLGRWAEMLGAALVGWLRRGPTTRRRVLDDLDRLRRRRSTSGSMRSSTPSCITRDFQRLEASWRGLRVSGPAVRAASQASRCACSTCRGANWSEIWTGRSNSIRASSSTRSTPKNSVRPAASPSGSILGDYDVSRTASPATWRPSSPCRTWPRRRLRRW